MTMLLLANTKRKGDSEDFGFVLSHSTSSNKKKDREKECAKDLVSMLDQLPFEDMRAWCQMPGASAPKREVDASDIEKLGKAVADRVPKATVEAPEPMPCVLVTVTPWGPSEGRQGYDDPELTLLDRFDSGFGELFKEARRVSGLVRQQWFLSIIQAKQDTAAGLKPFCLGVGFATDREVAKARALHAAEVRVQVLTEAMFVKATAVEN